VLEGGRIVELGNHEQLLARGGRYDEMVARQTTRAASPGATRDSGAGPESEPQSAEDSDDASARIA
jgi:hypothetical protein